MAQIWTTDCFNGAHAWDVDLAAMENNHLALQSGFSGPGAPSSPVAGQIWHRTGATAPGRRVRNAANTAWHKILTGDVNQKIWVYRNDTCEGWLIFTQTGDRVLAVKGGSSAYNIAGGNGAGTWTISGLSHGHWTQLWAEEYWTGVNQSVSGYKYYTGQYTPGITAETIPLVFPAPTAWSRTTVNKYVDEAVAGQHAGPHYNAQKRIAIVGSTNAADPQTSAWRPAAYVGTLQQPDLS